MKFAALNKETSAERTARPEPPERKATREAQESGCLQRYHEAIRLQQAGETGRARALYCEILGSKVMEEAEATMLRLKFLTFKNLGSIARGCGDDSAALDAFIQAVDVDGSDVTVWYQMGLAATSLGNLLLARTALDEARRCHAHYWPAIDLLCSLLLALNDDISCLQLISEVLPHLPDFPRGLAYLHHLADSSPQLLTFMPRLRLYLMKPCPPETEKLVEEAKQLARRRGLLLEVKVLEEPIKPPKPLAYYSLHSLGQSLVSLYRHCISLSSPSLASPIDVQLLCEGTSERPLLPNLVNLAPPTSSEEVSEEESGEGERREAKRRNPDLPTPVLPKRRSSRVKSRREQVCASERFAHFLPECLRGCEFGDVCALSPLPLSGEAPLPSFTDQSDCSVLDQPRLSSHVVKAFLQEHSRNSGVVSLIYNYLLLLAQRYNWHWSETSFSVVKVYMELYELVQSHLIFPSPLCSPGDPDYISLQNTAMICQCYSELKLDHLQRCPSSPTPLSLSQALSFSQMSCSDNGWSGSQEFLLRVRWCMFKRRQLEMDSRGALAVLRECHCLLEEKRCRVQVLPNLRQDPCISPVQVSRKIKDLEQVLASQEVFGMFESGDHSGVVSCLRPMLDWTSDNFSQLLLGGGDNEEQTPISLLLLSLLAMKRWQECLLCSVAGLQELLVSYKLGNERWVSALHTVYTHLDRCLEEAPGDLLQECGESLQRHLVVCVFRTLELQVEMTDSPLFHLLPLSLPCSVLYFSLLSLWEDGDVAMETRPEPGVDVMETETEQLPVVVEETDREAILGASPAVTTNQEGCRVSGSRWGLQFLCDVHDYLGGGGQGWCVGDKGRILHILVCRLREELRQLTAHPPKTRVALLRELEQCYYCLYGHPHKKAKAWGLQDHGAEQLPLTWDSAQVLLEFYHPSFLPAVEENRALTPELVSLYRKLVDIIPDTGKVIPLSVIAGYIEGRLESLPLPSPPAPHTSLVSEIFYLLADDALKSSDFL
ncbi:Calcineurin-binding protein cabin-1 [Geodia barretti]|uniref:Calcineurin-binding protein cabin-1 n=1 Tax=Geodia barretti TaxID=519541 RepID=A0AA35TYM2_GEOBA|nr:Calcineurin-binding protein cabin-1 [Geodia barretti]